MAALSAFGAQSVSAASITLTVPTEKALSLNLTPTASGSFNKSDAANITIKTDALAGYTLSIKAKDGTDLKNTTNPSDTNVISSLGSTTVSENDFKNVANTNYNNKWGFAFGQGTVGTTFRGLTGSTGVEIGRASEPNDTINTYSIVLGARVDNTIATGTYSNTFIVEASANPVPYKVSYNPNASSDQVKNMPDSNSGQTDTEAFTITEKQPTREGYRFIGWCDGTTTKETDVDICSAGKSYQPSDPYTLKEKSQNVTLLAMWAKDSQIMQNWKGCDSLEYSTRNNPKEITLVDVRDNKMYYVAKLADGRCWMTENLDLDIDGNRTYTVADTDLAYATEEDKGDSKDADGNYQWKPEKSTLDTNASTNDFTYTNARSYDAGDYCWRSGAFTEVSTDLKVGSLEFDKFATACIRHQQVDGSDQHYYLGNYYNYGATVAQNDTSNRGENTKYETSICPAGWQLPTLEDDDISTFEKLFNAAKDDKAKNGYEEVKYGTNGNIYLAPYYLFYAGYGRNFVEQLGYKGHYATNVVRTERDSWHLDISVSYLVSYAGGLYRNDGASIRCVVREK